MAFFYKRASDPDTAWTLDTGSLPRDPGLDDPGVTYLIRAAGSEHSIVTGGTSPIAALFPGPGMWHDVSDAGSVFADSAGTVPASVDGPVARIADRSGNGHHLLLTGGSAILRASGTSRWIETTSARFAIAAGLAMARKAEVMTMIAAVACENAAGLRPVYFWSVASGSSTRVSLDFNNGIPRCGGRRNDGAGNALAQWPATVTGSVILTGIFSPAGGTTSIRVGEATAIQQSLTGSGMATDDTDSQAAVALTNPGATAVFGGRFYGGIALPRTLAADQMSAVRAKLAELLP
jgi:hypothetical protein